MTDGVNRIFFGQTDSDGQGGRPNALLLGTLGRYLPDFSDKFGFVLQTCSFATYLRKWVQGTAVPVLNGDMTRAARSGSSRPGIPIDDDHPIPEATKLWMDVTAAFG